MYGYKGKQVRDNIHSYDVASLIVEFIKSPRAGEVYNLGGGKENSCSIIEAFKEVENITGNSQNYSYEAENRIGDHICYYSNLGKIKSHFPTWKITKSLRQIFIELVDAMKSRTQST